MAEIQTPNQSLGSSAPTDLPSAGMPKVSVVMPTCNGERFLRTAIESILAQTFRNFELLVVNDGSTDSTPHILDEYATKDDRIIVLTNPKNLGIAEATNRGLAAAAGEYVALQDHDDISLTHRLQTELDFLRSHPDIALVGSAATLIDESGDAYAEFPLPCDEIDIKWRLLFFGDAFHYTSIMVKREALLDIGGYGENPAFRFAEAYDPFSRLAMRYRVANIPEKLVLWRRHRYATSLQNEEEQGRSGDLISKRNISLLCNSGLSCNGTLDRSVKGFKAFALMPAGELPRLPADQIISGVKFVSELQKHFYGAHGFSRPAIARHRESLSWRWGKHAVAVSMRAPWSLRDRLRMFALGMRCLGNWAWTCLTNPGVNTWEDRITVPSIRSLSSPQEGSQLNRGRLKRTIKESAVVQRLVRSAVIPGVRGYLRYVPWNVGRKQLWRVVLMHYFGLEPPAWNFVTRTRLGSRISGNTRDVVPRHMFYFGAWEPNLTQWICSRLGPGDGFIDVGANVGYFTLLASKLVGKSGTVVAIEALPAIFAALQKNLQLNSSENVRAVNCAAWDTEELLTIYTDSVVLPGQTTVMPGWAGKFRLGTQLRVPAAPLSTILRPGEIKSARLIKIDVEGAEWQVLCGLKPLMASCRDDLEVIIEITPELLLAEGKAVRDFCDMLGTWGFHPYSLENEYSLDAYSPGRPLCRPRRLTTLPSEQTDIVFSRVDAEAL